MDFAMNLETFISMYDSETDAINDILLAHSDGRVETIEYTIPYYTYNRLANPPRFIAYSDNTPNRHSIEVRIKLLIGDTITIEFPVVCYKSSQWFDKHLANELCDGHGEFESDELNLTDPDDIECYALDLQRELNFRRVDRTRQYIIDNGADMLPDQFERQCRDLVDLLDENKAITARILDINYIQSIA